MKVIHLELGHQLHPSPMRTTEFAQATDLEPETVASTAPSPPAYGPPQWAGTWRLGSLTGRDFTPQPDGTLLCLAGQRLYPQERRPERDGTLRVLYAARIGSCRPWPDAGNAVSGTGRPQKSRTG